MGFGIYKQGQGYWVRVLTATFAGVIILAGSAWMWKQLEKAAQYIPRTAWTLNISPATGAAEPGQGVILLTDPARPGEAPAQIGTAVVEASDPTSAGGDRLTLKDVALIAGEDVSHVRSVAPAPGSAATVAGPVSGTPQGRPLFEPLYLQAAGVSLLVLLGALATYWFVGVSARTVEFLIATDGEMRKVNWSTRRDIMGSTMVVILWSVLIASGLFVVDLMFSSFFQLIGVLKR